jgi:hypothetical protein
MGSLRYDVNLSSCTGPHYLIIAGRGEKIIFSRLERLAALLARRGRYVLLASSATESRWRWVDSLSLWRLFQSERPDCLISNRTVAPLCLPLAFLLGVRHRVLWGPPGSAFLEAFANSRADRRAGIEGESLEPWAEWLEHLCGL